MSALALGFGWLIVASVATAVAAVHLQPLRDDAVRIADATVRQRRLTRLDTVFAALIASPVAAFAYLLFGVFVPSVIGWGQRFVISSIIVVPVLAFAAMMAFRAVVPDRLEPSLSTFFGYVWRIGVLWAWLEVLPAALTHVGAPGWIYPLALYLGVFAMMSRAFRRSWRIAGTPGATS